MGAALNIAALARRTGVAADTLRKWEQRHGVLTPIRTAGGQRRYTEAEVERVLWLQARLAEGYRIGEAAALLGRSDLPAAATPAELRDAVVASALAADGTAIELLLDRVFALHSIEDALTKVVEPALERVGTLWESGERVVASEHLLSHAVRARLEGRLLLEHGADRGRAVLACAPGERHELGLLMFAVLLRADGWQVSFLGADTPVQDAVDLAERTGADVVCLSATMPEHVADLERALGHARPRSKLVAGGDAIAPETAARLGVEYGEPTLRRTVRALRRAVPT